jgi:tripartite-type tricarboxylate transporter receptor subunit TctC
MTVLRRISVLLAGATLALGWGSAVAQGYPQRPVKIVVGLAPGGAADITIRLVAQKLGEGLKQPFIVQNMPGAGGIVAAQAVLTAPRDGHTLFLLSNQQAVSASLFKKLPYDPVADFTPVSSIGWFHMVVLADAQVGSKSLSEAVGAARRDPARLTFGSLTVGATQHLTAELIKSTAGLTSVTVPYKSTPDVISALHVGDVQLAFENLAPVPGQVQGGSLRALAVASEQRFAGLPGVPTMEESGYPGFRVNTWNGLAAPAGTPSEVVAKLQGELTRVLALPEVKQRFAELAVEARASTGDALATHLRSEIAKWRTVIERAQIERQ